MILSDLQFIFKNQLINKETKLVYLLEDNGYKIMLRHNTNEMWNLFPMIDNFVWTGFVDSNEVIPRFVK